MRCLDSTILIDVLRDLPAAKARVQAIEEEEPLRATEIGSFELYLGVQHLRNARRAKEEKRIKDLLDQMDLLPFERRSAIRAAGIAGAIRGRGQTISLADLFTAAVALGHGCNTIVTRDVVDFQRVPGLRVETY